MYNLNTVFPFTSQIPTLPSATTPIMQEKACQSWNWLEINFNIFLILVGTNTQPSKLKQIVTIHYSYCYRSTSFAGVQNIKWKNSLSSNSSVLKWLIKTGCFPVIQKKLLMTCKFLLKVKQTKFCDTDQMHVTIEVNKATRICQIISTSVFKNTYRIHLGYIMLYSKSVFCICEI